MSGPCLAAPLVVAHRGFSTVAPENTLAAFRLALEAGASAAECDVYSTADGHLVLMHDHTLARTTDRTGDVTALTFDQVRAADAGSWKGEQYRGERIPTLAEALALTAGRMRMVVEIKQEGIVPQVVAAVHQARALGEVTMVSFSLATCRQVRDLEPRLPMGWISDGIREDTDAAADELLQTALSVNAQFVSLAYPGAKPALLHRARLAGVSVWVWTLDDRELVQTYARMGVASITSNDPALALEALGAL
jgi:glycerophosphoryl diester phosphodiesterase